MALFEERFSEENKFDDKDAIALMHDLTLTKNQMRNVKSYLGQKNIGFPNTTQLLTARKQLKPEIKTELDGEGVSVDYISLVEMTTRSLLNTLLDDKSSQLDTNKPVNVVYKDGCDGAGSQTVWNSVSMNDKSDHMFQYSIVPLRVEQEGHVVWKNPTPNAAHTTRPVFLLRAEEDDPSVLDLVIPATDHAREELQCPRVIKSNNGTDFVVTHQIHDTMKDLKLKKKWSGLGGADCIICESQKKDWMDREKIVNGFTITRSAKSSAELYEKLVFEGEGEIARKSGDYDIRKGMTNRPMTHSDQHSITILHSYINVLGWFLKVLYRCHISYQCWIEKKTVLGLPLRRAKDRVQNILREKTGLVLDQVSGANDKTGTSNDGNQARRFFDINSRQTISDCVEDKYKDTVTQLHQNLSVILRIVTSTSQVDTE